ncbi:hypothetical protein EGH25_02365 [Haladaptatus sp. F3-133]|jgi:hypothetical protein|uniref:Uncharacterized protein n=1 Tax=Halorutilus salinus TaxID=2487751 RepID=A0A9Q4GGX1_9EURY|nr:hypothetical protein [Halorutilus salinus]MCX2818195.1 hypothetical protein [Halorutilus salinus]
MRLPTNTDDARLVARTVRLVNSSPAYAALSAVTGFVGLNLFVVSQNINLFINVVVSGTLALDARLAVLFGLYPFVGTAFTATEGVVLLVVAAFFGVNLSMLTYQLRENRVSLREGSGSAAGMALGVLGAGCAACGTAVLAGILSLFGAAGVLTLLPFNGLEFSLVALVLLALSVYWLADGMRGGEVRGCPVGY